MKESKLSKSLSFSLKLLVKKPDMISATSKVNYIVESSLGERCRGSYVADKATKLSNMIHMIQTDLRTL